MTILNVPIEKSEVIFSSTGFNYEIATAENGDGTEDIFFDSDLDAAKFQQLLTEMSTATRAPFKACSLFIPALLICLLSFTAQAQQWTPNKQYIKAPATAKAATQSYQCWGTTQKGLRCKNKVKADHSYCSKHQGQSK